MNAILNKIIKFDTLNIIGVYRKVDADVFYFLRTTKSKDKLEVASIKTFSTIEDLKIEVDNKTPMIILIDGKGVLNKRIDPKNETDLNWIKSLDYATIHHTTFTNENFQFLSFCRKNVVEDVMHSFHLSGYQIVDFYVGSIVSVLINDSLKLGQIFSNDSILEFETDELTNIIKSKTDDTKEYELGGILVSNFHLSLYSAALHFYIQQKSIAKSHSEKIDKEEIVYKKAFNLIGLVSLIGFFIALLTSYLLIQYFNAQNTKLNLENIYSNQSFQLIQDLEKQKENKLQIVNEMGFTSSKFISYYSYELTKELSSEITLTALDVFPLQKDIKSNEKVVFYSKTIIIKGASINETTFNLWLENLRAKQWIDSFEILSLKKDKKNISQFELKIDLKNV